MHPRIGPLKPAQQVAIASKFEPKSVAFTEIFNQILNKSNSDENSLTSIQKLLLNSIAKKDISAQEMCHLLLGISLYHSNRQYVSLNLNEEAPRCVRGTGSRETSKIAQQSKRAHKQHGHL
ncbi:hypothetical protein RhiirB3_461447 [Rhizophagus irregularis]|nr:hypothetical protein RhiirB3_461447 [Rhizophagus irregularis]